MKLPRDVGPIHFIGIGGIGMSGIAEVMATLGYGVQGSDLAVVPVQVAERDRGLGLGRDGGGHVTFPSVRRERPTTDSSSSSTNAKAIAAREAATDVLASLLPSRAMTTCMFS